VDRREFLRGAGALAAGIFLARFAETPRPIDELPGDDFVLEMPEVDDYLDIGGLCKHEDSWGLSVTVRIQDWWRDARLIDDNGNAWYTFDEGETWMRA